VYDYSGKANVLTVNVNLMRAVFVGERFSRRMQVNISIRYVNNKISVFNINTRTLFAEISKKNLTRYRSENNYGRPSK